MNININKIEEYPLSISNSYHSIILKYEDEYWIKSENENEPPLKDVSIKVAEYNFLIDYLIKLFDSKYKRIKSHSFANQYSWIKTNQNNFKILITLQPDFWYYGNNYYGTFDDIADDFKKHGSHSTQIIYDEKQSRYCLAYSNISIIYENYDMHQLLKKIEEDQKLKLIKNNSLKLKENGSNL